MPTEKQTKLFYKGETTKKHLRKNIKKQDKRIKDLEKQVQILSDRLSSLELRQLKKDIWDNPVKNPNTPFDNTPYRTTGDKLPPYTEMLEDDIPELTQQELTEGFKVYLERNKEKFKEEMFGIVPSEGF